MPSKGNFPPAYSYTTSPRGSLHSTGSPPSLAIGSAAASGSADPQVPSSSRGRRALKARRSLPLLDDDIAKLLADSGSDDDVDPSGGSDDEGGIKFFRSEINRLRQEMIEREEDNVVDGSVMYEPMLENVNENMNEDVNVDMNVSRPEPNVSTVFQWTDDFTSFTGQRESYRRDPGPTISSQDPVEIFLKIWDEDVMGLIATETNKYAREYIEHYTDPDIGATIPKYLEQWEDVTIPVLYQYFALMICMSFCVRSKIQEYWEKGFMEMLAFRQAMSRDVFLLITKFLHFVSDKETTAHGYARKIGKVAPILDHCNQKFSELYIPAQHISLDESLLLWKGRLSWRQCIRSKAARFSIKSFELCEATTGYLLKCKLYTGKESPMHSEPLHGFTNKTAKVVLDLMEGYLDVGHVLVMDNWYNQLVLTRYLKSRATDVLGTMSRTRKDVPQDLKDVKQKRVARGDWHARNCGDIALVTWKDVKLITVLSTYHDHQMVPGKRAGVARCYIVDYKWQH